MSISLPNGTILAAPSSSSSAPQLSAAVTRILHLSNFAAELKTRDLQNLFKEWEGDKGGFRIKWLDDVNALVVFADAGVAKRAYLSLLLSPPASFRPPAQIKPYDRPDAALIIQSLAARTMGHRSSLSSALQSASSSTINVPPPPPIPAHGRASSISSTIGGFKMPLLPSSTSASNARAKHQHQRSGSASSSWARVGGGAGALNFGGGGGLGRLPTHNEGETQQQQSRSSSASSGTSGPVVVMEENASGSWGASGGGGGGGKRRDSLSAERAMRQVEKALASVEAQG